MRGLDRFKMVWVKRGHVVLVFAMTFMMLNASTGQTREQRRLAVLIAAPWAGEAAMYNDLTMAYHALRQRGFAPEEILTLKGPRHRDVVLTFLQGVHQRVAAWPHGNVFFYVSGHGLYTGQTVAAARPGLQLTRAMPNPGEASVSWEDAFKALNIPSSVQLIVLPDV
jgi:hypothetical protein